MTKRTTRFLIAIAVAPLIAAILNSIVLTAIFAVAEGGDPRSSVAPQLFFIFSLAVFYPATAVFGAPVYIALEKLGARLIAVYALAGSFLGTGAAGWLFSGEKIFVVSGALSGAIIAATFRIMLTSKESNRATPPN
ncbi:MAG: hypothetical protein AAFN50_03230 [Pseudomonadota bacterium]